MKRIFKAFSILFVFPLFSCSSENNMISDYRGLGGDQSPAIKIESNRKGNVNCEIKVFLGHDRGLNSFWEKYSSLYDISEIKNGSYAVVRTIKDRKDTAVESSVRFIDDFLSNEKYLVKTEPIGYGAARTLWDYYYTDTYDFSTLSIKEGYIHYWFGYYDKYNDKQINKISFKENGDTQYFCSNVQLKFDSYHDGTLIFSERNS